MPLPPSTALTRTAASMPTAYIHLHLFSWLTVLATTSILGQPVPPPPTWATIILDKEIFGSPPPWWKIETLRKAVEQITDDRYTWDATADIADRGIW